MNALLLLLLAATTVDATTPLAKTSIPNPAIDYAAFLKLAEEVAPYREERRVSELEFLKLSRQEGTLVLDTRSAQAYHQLHVSGAVHLNFSDITKQRLAEVIPDKNTRILIYCNNNFGKQPLAFPEKRPSAALNIPTFITLYDYGYRNLYELGPHIDVHATKLELVRSETVAGSTEAGEATTKTQASTLPH